MKTLRFIGMALVAVIVCVNFAACSDDDDDRSGDAASLVGKWKIESATEEGETGEWDGHPYFVITDTHFYFTDEGGSTKSDYCTYTYNSSSKVMRGKYVDQDGNWDMKILSLSKTAASFQWDEEGDGNSMITINCKKVQ